MKRLVVGVVALVVMLAGCMTTEPPNTESEPVTNSLRGDYDVTSLTLARYSTTKTDGRYGYEFDIGFVGPSYYFQARYVGQSRYEYDSFQVRTDAGIVRFHDDTPHRNPGNIGQTHYESLTGDIDRDLRDTLTQTESLAFQMGSIVVEVAPEGIIALRAFLRKSMGGE